MKLDILNYKKIFNNYNFYSPINLVVTASVDEAGRPILLAINGSCFPFGITLSANISLFAWRRPQSTPIATLSTPTLCLNKNSENFLTPH